MAAVRRFLRLPIKTWRLLLAAALGGFFGLSALLPHIGGFPLLLLGLAQALALAAAAFAPKPPATLLKAAFLLLLFGAALSGLLSLLPFHGILLANGAVYFDISALLQIALTCAAYGVLYLFDRLSVEKRRRFPQRLIPASRCASRFRACRSSSPSALRSPRSCRPISATLQQRRPRDCGWSHIRRSERTAFCPHSGPSAPCSAANPSRAGSPFPTGRSPPAASTRWSGLRSAP